MNNSSCHLKTVKMLVNSEFNDLWCAKIKTFAAALTDFNVGSFVRILEGGPLS